MKKRILSAILTACVIASMFTPAYAEKKVLNIVSGGINGVMMSVYSKLGYQLTNDGDVATYDVVDTNTDAGQPNIGVNSKKESNLGNLTNGSMEARNGYNSNQSAWNGCDVTGVFDLGKVKGIDRVDIWWYQHYRQINESSLKLRVSNDKVNWVPVETTITRNVVRDVTKDLDLNVASHTFEKIDARYFEITLISNGQIYLDEVIAFGGESYVTEPSKNITVISGNVKSQLEIDRYRNLGYEVKWDDSAKRFSYTNIDLGIGGNLDQGKNELNDGNTQSEQFWGVWNSNVAVEIDLGSKKAFDRVDIWSSNAEKKALAVKISVSDDKVNWKDVVYSPVADSSEDGKPAMELIPVQFAPQNARYIKVYVYKKYSQVVLSEIFVINSQPGVLGMGLSGANGEVHSINAVKESGKIKASGEIAIGGVLMAAHYKFYENGLSSLQNFCMTEETFGDVELDLGDASDFEEGDLVKLFAFDRTDTLMPVETVMEIPVGSYPSSELLSENAENKAVTTGLWRNDIDVSPLFNGVTKGENAFADGYEYINVETTLPGVADIDYIDIYGKQIKRVKVFASMDGYNFDIVQDQEVSVRTTEGRTRIRIPGVCYAKKVRVLAMEASASRTLCEINVFGKYVENITERKMEYTYDDEVPFKTSEDVLTWDEDLDILSDGDTKNEIECYDDYLSVIYDLGEFCQVEDVTIYGYHGGVELLTSPDGMSYYTAGFFPCVDDVTRIWGRCEHNAKFAKLVFRGDAGDAIYLSEIDLNVRKISDWADENEIPVKVTVKPNNIIMIDWSDYRADLKGDFAYNVYIEDTKFTKTDGLTPKKVFTNHSTLQVQDVRGYYCTYAGLAPEKKYYVAVLPVGATNKSVSAVEIKTNPALGGGSISGIFCVNEYDGGAYVPDRDEIKAYLSSGTSLWEKDKITQAEIDAIPSNNNAAEKVRKLMADMEVVSKNRHYNSHDGNMLPYFPRGISWFASNMPSTQAEADRFNGWGVYTFGHTNEPEITSEYKNYPDKFGREFSQIIKGKYETLKKLSPDSLLYSPTTCGTDWLHMFEKLYEYEPDLSDYYDVCDIHTYSKTSDPTEEMIPGAETTTVPEKLFKKHDIISGIIETYGEEKEIVASEMGWPTTNTPSVMGNSDEQMQANFITRMYLCGIMTGMKEIYLYAFQNEGYLSNEEVAAGKKYIARVSKEVDSEGKYVYYIARSAPSQEHVCGIVDWYGNPRPGYFAYYTLGKVLKDCVYVERLEDIGDLNYGGVFYDEVKNKYVTALWNISGNGSSVLVESDEEELLCVTMYGEAHYIEPDYVEIGSSPIYIYSDLPLEISE